MRLLFAPLKRPHESQNLSELTRVLPVKVLDSSYKVREKILFIINSCVLLEQLFKNQKESIILQQF
jgi:hypothetical protein